MLIVEFNGTPLRLSRRETCLLVDRPAGISIAENAGALGDAFGGWCSFAEQGLFIEGSYNPPFH
jgi:hypothetical protein